MKMILTTMTTIKPQAILTMYKWMTANADSEYGNMALIVIIPIQCCSRSSGASFCWSCVCCKGDSLHWLSCLVIRAMPWLSSSHKTPNLRKRSAKSWFYRSDQQNADFNKPDQQSAECSWSSSQASWTAGSADAGLDLFLTKMMLIWGWWKDKGKQIELIFPLIPSFFFSKLISSGSNKSCPSACRYVIKIILSFQKN